MLAALFGNDNFFFVVMPRLAPLLVTLAWIFRRAWPAWIAAAGLLPFCLYIGFAPQLLFLPWLVPPLVALGAWQLRRRQPIPALGFFAGFLALWLTYFWWQTQQPSVVSQSGGGSLRVQEDGSLRFDTREAAPEVE